MPGHRLWRGQGQLCAHALLPRFGQATQPGGQLAARRQRRPAQRGVGERLRTNERGGLAEHRLARRSLVRLGHARGPLGEEVRAQRERNVEGGEMTTKATDPSTQLMEFAIVAARGPIERTRSVEELPRLSHPGGVDADGHVLEPPDLWERYLEPSWRDRALRIRKDERGLEYLEIDGRPSKLVRNGMPAGVGSMDWIGGYRFEREPTGCAYVDNAPFGAMDPKERLRRLDIEHLERAFLYPTLGVLWVAECEDEALAQAYVRAYNRWIVDFCADSGGRLVPVAQLSLGDPEAAAHELRRAAAAGARGVWVPPFTTTRKPIGHPDHDPVFAAAAELGLPFGIHPTFEPKWAAPGRYGEMTSMRYSFFLNVTASDAVRHGFTSLFQFGTLARFPDLKVVVLEAGASWIGYWLERMDSVYASPQGYFVREQLPEKPSFYFHRQCYVSADPDEPTLAPVVEIVGEDRFFWASDFPHPDHAPEYVPALERVLERLPASAGRKLLGENVLSAYGLA
jgi:predicted TIM-barrel fold metal-dependent hydrolase